MRVPRTSAAALVSGVCPGFIGNRMLGRRQAQAQRLILEGASPWDVDRVLTQFEQAGLLTRHHFESGKAVFELNEGRHHDHLVCLECGRVEEFYDAEIEERQAKVAHERGFKIADHALYLYAECVKPRCPYRKTGENS